MLVITFKNLALGKNLQQKNLISCANYYSQKKNNPKMKQLFLILVIILDDIFFI